MMPNSPSMGPWISTSKSSKGKARRAEDQDPRDLDEVIARLAARAPVDQLEIQRLKKRKLLLKDRITKIESELLPDIIA